MTVDLSSGTCGIIQIGSQRYWCPSIEPVKPRCHDEFFVRIESGWYNRYRKDGTTIYSSDVEGPDITEFIPCAFDDPRCEGLQTEASP